MELKAYGAVIWRWRWLALAVAAIVFVATLVVQPREGASYTAVFRVAIAPNIAQTDAEQANPAREQYYEFITAELLVDDAAYTLESEAFQQKARQPGERVRWAGR